MRVRRAQARLCGWRQPCSPTLDSRFRGNDGEESGNDGRDSENIGIESENIGIESENPSAGARFALCEKFPKPRAES